MKNSAIHNTIYTIGSSAKNQRLHIGIFLHSEIFP